MPVVGDASQGSGAKHNHHYQDKETVLPLVNQISIASPRIQGTARPKAVVVIRHVKARSNHPQYF